MEKEIKRRQLLRELGFPFLDFGRPYDPLQVKIKMPKETFGRDRFGKKTYFAFGPFTEWTETWMISAETDYRFWEFFIRHPKYKSVWRFKLDQVSILFEAEPFFDIMQNASRGNKLNFFRRAVIESDDEVKTFLEKVAGSNLSAKDKRRAKTWLYRRTRNLDI